MKTAKELRKQYRNYYQQNKERIKEYNQLKNQNQLDKYYEKYGTQKRVFYTEEERNERDPIIHKKYYQEHINDLKDYAKKYYAKNKKEINEYCRKYYYIQKEKKKNVVVYLEGYGYIECVMHDPETGLKHSTTPYINEAYVYSYFSTQRVKKYYEKIGIKVKLIPVKENQHE